ncbi:MAG: response regulator, partial [Gemmatimonadota bacterium]
VHILVVDDEPIVRRLAARVLAGQGYAVSEAEDGLEALHFIESQASELDVVVSDIIMPRLNGVELLQTLTSGFPHLPVILMSGFGHSRLVEMGVTAPCGILAKPFPPEALLNEVRRCIRQRN